MADPRLHQRNRRLLGVLLGVVAGMGGLAFASVPLYDLFCRVTGYGGTTQRAATFDSVTPVARTVTVRFDASVNGGLPWRFGPEAPTKTVHLGEPGLITYHARNLSARTVVGTALFNVTPAKAGVYFHKVQCFCFEEQRLEPGASAELPVSFYVDPAFGQDPDLAHLTTITLSYTFYPAASQALDKALDGLSKEAPALPKQSVSQPRGSNVNG